MMGKVTIKIPDVLGFLKVNKVSVVKKEKTTSADDETETTFSKAKVGAFLTALSIIAYSVGTYLQGDATLTSMLTTCIPTFLGMLTIFGVSSDFVSKLQEIANSLTSD